MSSNKSADILDFWFGTAREGGAALEQAFKRWFASDPDLDAEIETRFGDLLDQALAGGLQSWETEPFARLALIILLDQFTRNVYRGSSRAFAGDPRALELARKTAVNTAEFESLHPVEQMFALMPCQHAEDGEVQEQGVAAYRQLEARAAEHLAPLLRGARESAELHRDIIRCFGRFPHRNAVLGRKNTAEEQAWLDDDAPRFGQ